MTEKSVKPKAMIWTEAVSASGHIRVSNRLSKALQAQGFDVVVVTSQHAADMIQDGFGDAKVVSLPSLTPAGEYDPEDPFSFFKSVTPNGKRYIDDEAFVARRIELLKKTYDTEQPDVFIAEHWPIGRRKYDLEMKPLIEHIRGNEDPKARTKLVAYMRDATGRAEMEANPKFVKKILDEQFDHVLVQGDKDIIGLEATLGEMSSSLRNKTFYAGYPIDPASEDRLVSPEIKDHVVVSCGGGNQPDALEFYLNAIRAKKHSALKDKTWHLFVNADCPKADLEQIYAAAGEDGGSIIIERESPKFGEYLQHSAFAIIRGGMTAAEAALAKRPALIAPRIIYQEDVENNEQYMRANALAKQFSNIELSLPKAFVSPDVTATAIDRAYGHRFNAQPELLAGGPDNAAKILSQIEQGEVVEAPVAARVR